MNQSRWQTSAVRTVVVVLLIMSLLVTVQAVAAAFIVPTTPELVGPSGPFLVNLESVVFNADHTSDWTYKVAVSTTIANAVSHTSLGLLDPDCVITDYWASETFRTEPSTYENGHEVVKFEVLSKDGIKQAGEFYTFTFRILGANTQELDPDGTYVAVKYGTNPLAEGMVAGAICGTTAVDLTSVKAQAGMPSSMILIVLGLGATIASAGVLRKVHRA